MPAVEKQKDNYSKTIVIAICTFCRPEMLSGLLTNLEEISTSSLLNTVISILVVDNDINKSAKIVTEEAASTSKYIITYLLQPMKGLSIVRNTALEFGKDSDYIVFIDDDEKVVEEWLEELVSTALRNDAVFVIGPVRPTFPVNTPSFFISSGLYSREEYKDGELLYTGNSGNALIDMRFIESKSIRFRDQFNSSGGEDSFFFTEIIDNNGKGVFASNAIAYEPVAIERLRIYWLLIRRCRFGSTQVISLSMKNKNRPFIMVKFILIGSVRLLATPLLVIFTLPFRPGLALRYLCGGARGFGFILGALGFNINEYK